jgi:protein subunit release factor B
MRARIEITPGAGGNEPNAFFGMLKNMYLRWAEQQGYSVEEEAENILIIEGEELGKLEQEHGIHRLTRISPTDPVKRRHTSFCKVRINELPDPEWGAVVRSYTLALFNLAKNHTNDLETNDVQWVLNGNPGLLWD